MATEKYAGKSELIDWVNRLLNTKITRLEQFTSGAIYCQILDAYFPDAVIMGKVNFLAKDENSYLKNYKVFQAGLTKLGIEKEANVAKMAKSSQADLLGLLQWLYKYLSKYEAIEDYDAVERRSHMFRSNAHDLTLPVWLATPDSGPSREPNNPEAPNSPAPPQTPLGDKKLKDVKPRIDTGRKIISRPSSAGSKVTTPTARTPSAAGRSSSQKAVDLGKSTDLTKSKVNSTSKRPSSAGSELSRSNSKTNAGNKAGLKNANSEESARLEAQAKLSALDVDGQSGWGPDDGSSIVSPVVKDLLDAAAESCELAVDQVKDSAPGLDKLLNAIGTAVDGFTFRGRLHSLQNALSTMARHTNGLLHDVLKQYHKSNASPARLQTLMALQRELNAAESSLRSSWSRIQKAMEAQPLPLSTALKPNSQAADVKELASAKDVDTMLRKLGSCHAALLQQLHSEASKITARFLDCDQSGNGTNGRSSHTKVVKVFDYHMKRLKNGDVFKGKYVNNRKNGEGVYHFMNNDVYEGEFKDDRMQGSGVYTFSHEGRYEGAWVNAVYQGAGSETFAKGSTYHGQYAQGLRSGWGACRFHNGDYYEGQWVKGLRDGRGMQQCTDDSNYVGQYAKGKRHGFGIYSFPNGDQYVGRYEEDIPHGHGVYIFASGQKYEGQWQKGKKHGWSIYTVETGEQWAGQWSEGKPMWVQPLPSGNHPPANAEMRENLDHAWEACNVAKQAASEAQKIATEHWLLQGEVQLRMREAVGLADSAALDARDARQRACEMAETLDRAADAAARCATRPTPSREAL